MGTDQEYADAFASDAQRAVGTLTKELRTLADRLDRMAPGLTNPNISPSGHAADIVSDYTQGVGSLGSRLWAIVHNAGKAEHYRAVAGQSSSD